MRRGYLTNSNVTRDNVQTIADGGRRRWVIENQGFNAQKTGCELEHFCGCKDPGLMLCMHALLPIAHPFMQLRNTHIPGEAFAPDAPKSQRRFAKAPP